MHRNPLSDAADGRRSDRSLVEAIVVDLLATLAVVVAVGAAYAVGIALASVPALAVVVAAVAGFASLIALPFLAVNLGSALLVALERRRDGTAEAIEATEPTEATETTASSAPTTARR